MAFKKQITQSGKGFQMTITADIEPLDMVSLLLSGNNPTAFRHIQEAMQRSVEWTRTQVVEKTPGGSTGMLRKRTGTAVDVTQTSPYNIHGEVFTDIIYAIPVEEGTKPHFPPRAAILYWVERKLGLSGKAAENASWAICTAIAKRGTKGQHMFEQGYVEAEPYIIKQFEQAVEKIEKDILNA